MNHYQITQTMMIKHKFLARPKCKYLTVAAVFMILAGAIIAAEESNPKGGPKSSAESWRGAHLMAPPASKLPVIERAISEVLAPMGVNVIVFEINYNFNWRSHPELRTSNAISRNEARHLSDLCRSLSIRLIPLFNCLGHQSWSKNTFPLLSKYPELDETPDLPKENPGIYCRSWCPLHPNVNPIVFALLDELIDAFGADALHVGMDEVFLIASDQCQRCKGKDPATLFAKAVNDLHGHLVDKRKTTMLMWGDRLLDDAQMKYGKWEASQNGTAPAIDLIPKDIVICDWHYELREAYPSVPYFQEKGYRVWPASWRNNDAALALLKFSRQNATDKMIGHLCTTWTSSEQVARTLIGEDDPALLKNKDIVESLQRCMAKMSNAVSNPDRKPK